MHVCMNHKNTSASSTHSPNRTPAQKLVRSGSLLTRKLVRPGSLLTRKLVRSGSLLTLAALLSTGLTGCGSDSSASAEAGNDNTLVVFNYGDYIDMDTLDMFEEETGIHVKYEQYVTPEDMYTKYSSGSIPYDLICTSDYMVEKMIQAGQTLPIDTSNMEYYDNLDPVYMEFAESFDPGNKYAVPYFFGTVGILYNTSMVEDESEVESWSVLWDEKYKSSIVMENSMRDAFLVPLKWKGHSLNSKDKTELQEALDLLKEQKPLLMAYLVDETRDMMIAGDAALSVIYSGDASVAMEDNEDLEYAIPEEGSNLWIDCWYIPDSCQHKENAEKFIDFMNRPDIAMMNFDYVWYGTPNLAVKEELDEETQEDPTVFPPDDVLEKLEVYNYLGDELDAYYCDMWKELKSY